MSDESIVDLKRQLERTQAELRMLYEISNAMRSTLKLNEILYMILTAITCNEGLGFNRAMLFLLNEKKRTIDGTMAIGAASAEEASHIWHEMELQDIGMDDLIYSFHTWNAKQDTALNDIVKEISLPLKEGAGIIAQACVEGLPFAITDPEKRALITDHTLDNLQCKLFVAVPLYSHSGVQGTIIADNLFSGQPITRDDIRLLMMFANQAGRAIENSRLFERTLKEARTDSLTRLWNHGTFQDRANRAFNEIKGRKSRISALMIDIDYFKHYNDTAGHAAGDKVITGVADVLRDCMREGDIPARYGGEEFAVIMPDTDKNTAFEVAENIRNTFEKRRFTKESKQPEGNLTVSIGVATYPDDARSKDGLLRKADMALYSAKQAGRNRTRTA